MSTETVRDVGEFGLIDRLVAALPPGARGAGGDVLLAAGDDAAVLWLPPGRVQVVTTDALIEGNHFRLDWTDWESLGHKALAVNISDIAAMGGVPAVAVVTLGLRGDELVRDLEAMYHGMGALAERLQVVIVGGDIVRVDTERLVSVTVLGSADPDRLLLRSAAMVGDAIGVTGTIGASAAGLEILREPERYRGLT
ncbi:MAG TPA: AIR synthase related protein, partial [Thermomicrobiales bacterium]|nr:AIR synthase related protein [Thermomicrobiales bacterium]